MPRKTKTAPADGLKLDDALIDQLMQGLSTQEELFGRGGLVDQLKGRIIQRALDGELSAHLGYPKQAPRPDGQTNARNGYNPPKTVRTTEGEIQVRTPRDREGSFDPVILPKGVRSLPNFDNAVLHLYAQGMSVRDIQRHLLDIYQTEVSPELISSVTDEVMEEVIAWRSRPLDEVYPIVFFDALVARVREGSRVVKKSVYLALGINLEGSKELLGMWIGGEAEGAKFWLGVLTELKNRGLKDIFIACVDGLKGFPDAIEVEYPQTKIQLCIVHMIRGSLRFVGYRDRKPVADALKTIYQARIEESALSALDQFEKDWGDRFPLIVRSWRSNWENLRTFFEYPPDIRRVIYTTNAVESLNHSMRKVLKNRKALPNDDALLKVLYLGLRNAMTKWTRPITNWKAAMGRFAIEFGDRLPS